MSNNFNTQQNNAPKIKQRYTTRNAIVNYYLAIMFTVFPLFASNHFFNIRHDKYYLFLAVTGIAVAAEVLLILSVKFGESAREEALDEPSYLKLTFTDGAMLALLITSLISTMFSSYGQEALFGSMHGRNNGLFLTAFYVGAYFIITRCYKYMEYVFLLLAAGCAAVYLLSVLNFFYIDPLGMYKDLSERSVQDFTSTIGNKNLMSSFICVTMPVLIAFSVHTKKLINKIAYIAASALGFAALMAADSDSGILGVGMFVLIYFIWYSRRITRLKWYALCLFAMLLSGRVLGIIIASMERVKELGYIQYILLNSRAADLALVVLAIATLLLFILDFKKPDIVLPRELPVVLFLLLALVITVAISAVIYFSVINTKVELGSLSKLLRFNEKWGTHRGFMWIKAVEIFNNAPFFQKLFGTGPDTFYQAFSPYFMELSKYGDTSTNAAHNEYLNYLVTIGIAGLASYLAVVGSAIVRAVKTAKKNPLAIVFVSAVICYSAQAVVNIAQPITTPLFIIFLSLTEAVSRNESMLRKF